MGADPPAIAGFGGAALSAGLSDMVAGSVVGAVSMDSCLISDIRARQVRLLRARNLAKGNPKENSEAEERKAYAETARFAQTTFRNGSKENDTSRDDQYLPNGCRSENCHLVTKLLHC